MKIYNNIAYCNRTNGREIGNWGEEGINDRPIKDVIFINNTTYDNGVGDWGGGIYIENPDAKNITVRNNIFSQNLLYQIAHEVNVAEQNLLIDHNLIDGFRNELDEEIRGNDYIEGDPKFVNSSRADFHLRENSPAINNGSPIDAPAVDFIGNPRPQGTDYDIGAFEYVEGGVGIDWTLKNSPLNFKLFPNYPNPFNSSTVIEFEIPNASNVTLKLFDILGKEVATLLNEESLLGKHRVVFEAQDLPSGIYIYQLKTSSTVQHKKLVIVN